MHEADDLDRAAELTQQLTDAYISNARSKARPGQVQNADGSWPTPDCIDCEEPIPEARLRLGCLRCIDCQTIWEKLR